MNNNSNSEGEKISVSEIRARFEQRIRQGQEEKSKVLTSSNKKTENEPKSTKKFKDAVDKFDTRQTTEAPEQKERNSPSKTEVADLAFTKERSTSEIINQFEQKAQEAKNKEQFPLSGTRKPRTKRTQQQQQSGGENVEREEDNDSEYSEEESQSPDKVDVGNKIKGFEEIISQNQQNRFKDQNYGSNKKGDDEKHIDFAHEDYQKTVADVRGTLKYPENKKNEQDWRPVKRERKKKVVQEGVEQGDMEQGEESSSAEEEIAELKGPENVSAEHFGEGQQNLIDSKHEKLSNLASMTREDERDKQIKGTDKLENNAGEQLPREEGHNVTKTNEKNLINPDAPQNEAQTEEETQKNTQNEYSELNRLKEGQIHLLGTQYAEQNDEEEKMQAKAKPQDGNRFNNSKEARVNLKLVEDENHEHHHHKLNEEGNQNQENIELKEESKMQPHQEAVAQELNRDVHSTGHENKSLEQTSHENSHFLHEEVSESNNQVLGRQNQENNSEILYGVHDEAFKHERAKQHDSQERLNENNLDNSSNTHPDNAAHNYQPVVQSPEKSEVQSETGVVEPQHHHQHSESDRKVSEYEIQNESIANERHYNENAEQNEKIEDFNQKHRNNGVKQKKGNESIIQEQIGKNLGQIEESKGNLTAKISENESVTHHEEVGGFDQDSNKEILRQHEDMTTEIHEERDEAHVSHPKEDQLQKTEHMDHSEEAKRNSNREHETEIYTQKEEFAHVIHEQKNEGVAHKVDVKESVHHEDNKELVSQQEKIDSNESGCADVNQHQNIEAIHQENNDGEVAQNEDNKYLYQKNEQESVEKNEKINGNVNPETHNKNIIQKEDNMGSHQIQFKGIADHYGDNKAMNNETGSEKVSQVQDAGNLHHDHDNQNVIESTSIEGSKRYDDDQKAETKENFADSHQENEYKTIEQQEHTEEVKSEQSDQDTSQKGYREDSHHEHNKENLGKGEETKENWNRESDNHKSAQQDHVSAQQSHYDQNTTQYGEMEGMTPETSTEETKQHQVVGQSQGEQIGDSKHALANDSIKDSKQQEYNKSGEQNESTEDLYKGREHGNIEQHDQLGHLDSDKKDQDVRQEDSQEKSQNELKQENAEHKEVKGHLEHYQNKSVTQQESNEISTQKDHHETSVKHGNIEPVSHEAVNEKVSQHQEGIKSKHDHNNENIVESGRIQDSEQEQAHKNPEQQESFKDSNQRHESENIEHYEHTGQVNQEHTSQDMGQKDNHGESHHEHKQEHPYQHEEVKGNLEQERYNENAPQREDHEASTKKNHHEATAHSEHVDVNQDHKIQSSHQGQINEPTVQTESDIGLDQGHKNEHFDQYEEVEGSLNHKHEKEIAAQNPQMGGSDHLKENEKASQHQDIGNQHQEQIHDHKTQISQKEEVGTSSHEDKNEHHTSHEEVKESMNHEDNSKIPAQNEHIEQLSHHQKDNEKPIEYHHTDTLNHKEHLNKNNEHQDDNSSLSQDLESKNPTQHQAAEVLRQDNLHEKTNLQEKADGDIYSKRDLEDSIRHEKAHHLVQEGHNTDHNISNKGSSVYNKEVEYLDNQNNTIDNSQQKSLRESFEHSKPEQPNYQKNEDKAIQENHLEKASNNQQNTEDAYRHEKINYSSQHNLTETQEREERKADTIYIVQQENSEAKAEEHLSREKAKIDGQETADLKQVHENENGNPIFQEKPKHSLEIHEGHYVQRGNSAKLGSTENQTQEPDEQSVEKSETPSKVNEYSVRNIKNHESQLLPSDDTKLHEEKKRPAIDHRTGADEIRVSDTEARGESYHKTNIEASYQFEQTGKKQENRQSVGNDITQQQASLPHQASKLTYSNVSAQNSKPNKEEPVLIPIQEKQNNYQASTRDIKVTHESESVPHTSHINESSQAELMLQKAASDNNTQQLSTQSNSKYASINRQLDQPTSSYSQGLIGNSVQDLKNSPVKSDESPKIPTNQPKEHKFHAQVKSGPERNPEEFSISSSERKQIEVQKQQPRGTGNSDYSNDTYSTQEPHHHQSALYSPDSANTKSQESQSMTINTQSEGLKNLNENQQPTNRSRPSNDPAWNLENQNTQEKKEQHSPTGQTETVPVERTQLSVNTRSDSMLNPNVTIENNLSPTKNNYETEERKQALETKERQPGHPEKTQSPSSDKKSSSISNESQSDLLDQSYRDLNSSDFLRDYDKLDTTLSPSLTSEIKESLLPKTNKNQGNVDDFGEQKVDDGCCGAFLRLFSRSRKR